MVSDRSAYRTSRLQCSDLAVVVLDKYGLKLQMWDTCLSHLPSVYLFSEEIEYLELLCCQNLKIVDGLVLNAVMRVMLWTSCGSLALPAFLLLVLGWAPLPHFVPFGLPFRSTPLRSTSAFHASYCLLRWIIFIFCFAPGFDHGFADCISSVQVVDAQGDLSFVHFLCLGRRRASFQAQDSH